MSAMRDDEGYVRYPGDAGTGDAGAARALLAKLQRSAAEAYEAIKAEDDGLRVLAGRRVTAERALRSAAARHQAASRAAAAHARTRPGPFAQLATRFRARREWRQQRPPLEAALAAAERQLATTRQALSEAKDDFTAAISARAEVAATLRRLTAECAAAQARIAAANGGNTPGDNAAASLRGREENWWDNGWRA